MPSSSSNCKSEKLCYFSSLQRKKKKEKRKETLETDKKEMASEGIGIESDLVRLCIEAASQSRESVEIWRRQRRTLERMPSQLGEALLRRLLRRRLVSPSLLEVFQHCIEEIDLRGESSVDAEWMAYVGAFRYLRSLNIADCRGINNSALWAITGMASLKEVDLSRCLKITDAGIMHLLSIPNLEKLCISETRLTADGVALLASLRKLSVLDLGGLPVTDLALCSLQVLTKLQYLDLWGSKISNKGAAVLKMFPKLNFLNLAWTSVTKLPDLPSVACLNMSNCTIDSIFEGGSGFKAPPLAKLLLHGATFIDMNEAFFHIEASYLSFFDVSSSSLHNFHFLANMEALEHLDLSSSRMGDDSVELIERVGENLRNLNLSNTSISSAGVGILAGNVPNLATISLSHTAIDDVALSYIGMMPSLRVIDLSNTNIKGVTNLLGNEPDQALSLAALQNLSHLGRLNLEDTQVRDVALYPLSCLQELNHLSLRSDFLSDISLYHLSFLSKLKYLGICGAVLTNAGLHLFNPPAILEVLDLRGCWLLTEDAISSFCENHPKIEVRHELVCAADQNVCHRSSPSHGTASTSQLKPKRGKISLAQGIFRKESFVDERLKYSRTELLELQFSSISLVSPHNRGIVLPEMLTE
ncbi:hypothetical protein HHK36_027540 [Tetracentron sinense]|uniref:F-box/LRR-repeat protein 15-like leucin rich repeat domain-containing protein n=1 Tax=Tetracentron sinense TaxID=13715 RepID=A0A834YJB6_TETSI|nr:hypothetical protein HHK36_027540 [Tetracentron sinense]